MFGSPVRIVSDRGAAFTSNDFKEFCERSKVQHSLTTTGVARGNGQVERINGIIVPALAKMSVGDPLKWYRHVSDLQRYINSTKTRSTGRSPFRLMFGVEMRNPEDNRFAEEVEEALREEFETDRVEERDAAKEAIIRIQEENRKAYNRQRKPSRQYDVGDLVAIKKTQFATGAKVQPKYLGPYRVTGKTGPDRYEVERVGGDGPARTATAADFMKPWMPGDAVDETGNDEDEEEAYETDDDEEAEVYTDDDTVEPFEGFNEEEIRGGEAAADCVDDEDVGPARGGHVGNMNSAQPAGPD